MQATRIESVMAGQRVAGGDVAQDRVLATQRTFRVVLEAMANPGRVLRLPWPAPMAELGDGSERWSAALLLTLADHEVTLATVLRDGVVPLGDAVRHWVRTEIVEPGRADYIVADAALIAPETVVGLRRGSLEYPDDSATLILQVDEVGADASEAETLTLTGPGVDGEIALGVAGLPAAVLAARATAVAQYPTGIDLLLVDGQGRVAAIPRTTVITGGSTAAGEGR